MHGRAIADVFGQHSRKHEVVVPGKILHVEGADVGLDLLDVVRSRTQLLSGDVEDGVVEFHGDRFVARKEGSTSPSDLTDGREPIGSAQLPAMFLVLTLAICEIELVKPRASGLHVISPRASKHTGA